MALFAAMTAAAFAAPTAGAATFRVPLSFYAPGSGPFYFAGSGPVLAGDSLMWLDGTGMSHPKRGKPVRFDFALRRVGADGRVRSIAFHRSGVPRYPNNTGPYMSLAASSYRVAYAVSAYSCDTDLCRWDEDSFGGTFDEVGWGPLTSSPSGPLTALDASCRLPYHAPTVGYGVAAHGTAVAYVDYCANAATWIDDPQAPVPHRVRIVPGSGESFNLGDELGPPIAGSHWLVVPLYAGGLIARVYDTNTGAPAFDVSPPQEVRGIADDGTVLLLHGSQALTATPSAPTPQPLSLPMPLVDARLAGEQIAFIGSGAAGKVVGLASTSGAVRVTASAPSDGATIVDFDGTHLALITTVCGLEYAEVWDPTDPASLTPAPGQRCPAARIGGGTLRVRHGHFRLNLRCGSGAGLACEGNLSGVALIPQRGRASRRVRLFSPPWPGSYQYVGFELRAGARGSTVIDLGRRALALLRQHPRLAVEVSTTAPQRGGVSGPALTSKTRIVLRNG